LGEYLHLFFFSLVLTLIFFGGWELPNFIFNWFSFEFII
jgi:NADH:ubiquinone oxidoreductase subunit H